MRKPLTPEQRERARARSRAWHYANLEHAHLLQRKWREAHPEQKKATDRAYQKANRERIARVHHLYYLARVPMFVKKARLWQKAHPERHLFLHRKAMARYRQAPGKHTIDHERILLSLQRGLCYYCGKPMDGTPELEHMVPVTRGGSNDPDNLCFACRPCNMHKSNRTAIEYLAVIGADPTIARIAVDKYHAEWRTGQDQLPLVEAMPQ